MIGNFRYKLFSLVKENYLINKQFEIRKDSNPRPQSLPKKFAN